MRILQLVQKPQRRGAEVFAYQLSHELSKQGHKVQTAYLYPYNGEGSLTLNQGDHVLGGYENHYSERIPGLNWSLLTRLASVTRTFKPDIVQLNGARTVKYGAALRYLTNKQDCSFIYRNIGDPAEWVRGWKRTLFYQRLVMPAVDGVVGLSQQTVENLRRFYSLSVPSTCIPNGIEGSMSPSRSREDVRTAVGTPLDAPVLVFVGSLSHEKRVDRLLDVTHELRKQHPDLHTWIIGNGVLRNQLEEQATSLSIADQTHFLGVQSDVASFMSAADVFILTSDTEGIPAVVLEAGLLGLPVVATRVGALSECIQHNITGMLIPPEDLAGIAHAAHRLIISPPLRNQLGRRAQGWIKGTFTMNHIAAKYIAFYQDVRSRYT